MVEMERSPSREIEVSPAYANYVLGLLFTVYVFNFIDRQILGILLEAIKSDLGVSDTAMGLLTGFAFAFFYTIAGIPIARLADRHSRSAIIAVGLTVWSVMTAASGLARNFSHLALARVLVGVGEAAGSPPAHSLISDYFPPERRGTALSVYASGVYIGTMLAFLAGGYIVEHFSWRAAFFVVGMPGVLLALLVGFTIRELPRGFSEANAAAESQDSIGDVLRFLASRRSFLLITTAGAVQSLSGYGVLIWGPTFLRRVHGMGIVDIGIWLGLIVGIGGTVGAYLGGSIADRLGRRDPRWYVFLSALVCGAGVPFGVGFLLLPTPWLALLSFLPFYLLGAMYVGPMLWVTQGLVKLRMRATASAILLFVLNLVGLGAGPVVVGLMNDLWATRFGDEAIRYSLLVVTLTGVLSSALFLLASRSLREELAAVRPEGEAM
jgi:MFS family permease